MSDGTQKGWGAGRSGDPVREVLLERGLWQVSTVSPGDTVHEALTRMKQRNVGALVVTERDSPVGVISERDCARRVLLEGRDPGSTSVESVMNRVVCSVTANKEVSECIELMLRRHIRHLPVLFGCCLVGCVSLRNLMEYVCEIDAAVPGAESGDAEPSARKGSRKSSSSA